MDAPAFARCQFGGNTQNVSARIKRTRELLKNTTKVVTLHKRPAATPIPHHHDTVRAINDGVSAFGAKADIPPQGRDFRVWTLSGRSVSWLGARQTLR